MSNQTKITLNDPIVRGKTEISELDLREPRAGELRGIKLLNLVEMETSAYAELLPRITQPAITKEEFNTMSLRDFTQVISVVGGFFEGKHSPTV